MTPLITVITLSYNNDSTILRAIDSVLCQSYPKIQYIVSDDCSESFDSKSIHDYIQKNNKGNIVELLVLKNTVNKGISKNLNTAISYANGQYLFNVAADDEFYDDRVLEEWTRQFQTTGAEVITALRAVYDENLEKYLFTLPNKKECGLIKNSAPKELFEHMTGKNLIFVCCTARTKRSYALFGGYDEKYSLIEDYPSNMKLLRSDVRIGFWDRIVIKYRSGGISSPEHISDSYLKISEDIFNNEILPYTSNQKKARANFRHWRNECIWSRDGNKYMHKHKNRPGRFRYLTAMFFKHPLISFQLLKKKINDYAN